MRSKSLLNQSLERSHTDTGHIGEGLHRVKIDRTGDVCVVPEGANQYAIW